MLHPRTLSPWFSQRNSIKKSVKRIADEALGIKVKIKSFYGYLEYFSEVKERGFGYTVTLVFICEPVGSTFKLDDQARKMDYFKTPPDNTIQEQKKLLNKLSGKYFPQI